MSTTSILRKEEKAPSSLPGSTSPIMKSQIPQSTGYLSSSGSNERSSCESLMCQKLTTSRIPQFSGNLSSSGSSERSPCESLMCHKPTTSRIPQFTGNLSSSGSSEQSSCESPMRHKPTIPRIPQFIEHLSPSGSSDLPMGHKTTTLSGSPSLQPPSEQFNLAAYAHAFNQGRPLALNQLNMIHKMASLQQNLTPTPEDFCQFLLPS